MTTIKRLKFRTESSLDWVRAANVRLKAAVEAGDAEAARVILRGPRAYEAIQLETAETVWDWIFDEETA